MSEQVAITLDRADADDVRSFLLDADANMDYDTVELACLDRAIRLLEAAIAAPEPPADAGEGER